MTTVYLCIGLQKTGTSALQKFLRNNREELQKQNCCYPLLELGIDKKYNDRNGHFLVYRAIELEGEQRAQREAEVRRNAFDKLGKIAKKYKTIILSDELIWHRSKGIPNFWQNVIEEFKNINCEVKFHVYLRRQDLFIQSLWNQAVKAMPRIDKSFKECMETNHFKYYPLDYYEYLENITREFGKENLILRVYERGQFEGGSLFKDFFKSVHLEITDDFVYEENARNIGLDGNFLEIRRWWNSIPEYSEMKDFMRSAVYLANENLVLKGLSEKKSMFSYEEQLTYLQSFEESNRKVATEYLGREDGILFYEPVQELEEWQFEPENFYRDIVLVMGEAFCQQEKKLMKMEEQIKVLERSVIFRAYRYIQRKFKK